MGVDSCDSDKSESSNATAPCFSIPVTFESIHNPQEMFMLFSVIVVIFFFGKFLFVRVVVRVGASHLCFVFSGRALLTVQAQVRFASLHFVCLAAFTTAATIATAVLGSVIVTAAVTVIFTVVATIIIIVVVIMVSVSVSAQDGIVALGKVHTRFVPSTSSLPMVALETVPLFAWLNTDRSRPWRVECRPLPFSTPLSFRRSML